MAPRAVTRLRLDAKLRLDAPGDARWHSAARCAARPII